MERTITNLNVDWLYIPKDLESAAETACDEAAFKRVSLPHTNIELPYHNFSEKEHCFVSWYRKHFEVPADARGRRVLVDFAGVMTAASVFVNGRQVGEEHKGGYTPFSVDITDHIEIGRDNLLAVRVDSTERSDIPPFGFVVDYLTFGGIYRDVELRIVDPIHIEHIIARPGDVMSERKRLEIMARVANRSGESKTLGLIATLRDADGTVLRTARDTVTVQPHSTVDDGDLHMEALAGIEVWDLENPKLYTLTVAIEDDDAVSARIGWRKAEFREDGAFYLNDKPIKLRGLNRHQTYPYIGQAAPARLQRKDADILKHELACNIVRTSHYPQSTHFLDRCDEIGLLVLEEIPGWQHIGDEAWKAISIRDVEAMVTRDRNRPSVILWGVRINESRDDHDFYARTNDVARRLDPTRPTGGVRNFFESELLEDVYTNNDFAYDLSPPAAPRYLNTEFCGHMYPTKTFDQEERVRQHALHHAHIHNQIGGMKSAGGIGWCAFDYNTHAVFGSGDRICHHGVMDIFRQPKFAAAFYASQADPAARVVLEPATYWKMGDKNEGGVEPLVIFSNCDEVEIIVGDASRGRYAPDRAAYPNLPHPPYVITGLGHTWGEQWRALTVIGFIKGKKAAERKISNDGIPVKLVMTVDDPSLQADGADMTRVGLRITDAFDNMLPFAMQPVQLELSGPGVLVGDNPFPMPGGRGAVYVRASRNTGTVVVTAKTPRLATQSVRIEVV